MGVTGPRDETTIASTSASTPSNASAETRRAPTPAQSGPSHSGWLSSSSPADGRFASGIILADRYRIIGLLGRGGMGEVYRADDLRLGQPVALKFLPESVSGNAVRLAQFHNEVRTARQVSHRNVCRVYDIGEADGRIFLTMEFVDGEDLASLLRRIGRFPQDRAIEIARQLCAGLAAAHDQGVLHRDLKPANVMIDRDGRVRITDFGLAGIAGEIHDIRAGTPAYMAPEQLAGREVSTRSDLFALGLVLFETFTGRRAFDAKNVAELLRMHDQPLALTPTSAVRELDPAVERVILRCLEREASKRPATAIAVSASLPGGDPLAAALAAGETPSPEMVANAGRREAVAPIAGVSAIAIIILGLFGLTAFSYQYSIIHRAPFEKPPAVLAERARTVLETLGYREAPRDAAAGFGYDNDYAGYVVQTRTGPDRWRELPSGRAPAAFFWYRTSPERLVPEVAAHRVWKWDPPFTTPGMTLVQLDTTGRLAGFNAIPRQRDVVPSTEARSDASGVTTGAPSTGAAPPDASSSPGTLDAVADLAAGALSSAPSGAAPGSSSNTPSSAAAGSSPNAPNGARASSSSAAVPASDERAGDARSFASLGPEPDWSRAFAAADLPMTRFKPVTPEWTPRAFADRRAAWTGTIPEAGNLSVRIEAAAYRGRITSFQMIYPWSVPSPAEVVPRTLVQQVMYAVGEAIYFGLFLVALVMARRNMKLRRGDRDGAFWLATVGFVCAMLQWCLGSRHIADVNIWTERFYVAGGLALLQAARFWIFYLALEPTVRRFWPVGMISWSRLVSGDWRDPLVGWHVLAGVACGVVLHLTLTLGHMMPALLGLGQPRPIDTPVWYLLSAGVYASVVARSVFGGSNTALFVVFCYAVARRFLRRDLYASLAVTALFAVVIAHDFVTGVQPIAEVTFLVALCVLLVVMLRRFGVLAAIVTYGVNALLDVAPLTFDLSAWYAYAAIWTLFLILALALYGFRTSRAGEPLFGRSLLGEAADA